MLDQLSDRTAAGLLTRASALRVIDQVLPIHLGEVTAVVLFELGRRDQHPRDGAAGDDACPVHIVDAQTAQVAHVVWVDFALDDFLLLEAAENGALDEFGARRENLVQRQSLRVGFQS